MRVIFGFPVVYAIVTVLLMWPAGQSQARSGGPNIVFIIADDLGWGELGCYGQQKIRTPNIDRLASEGMRFTQHYSGAPTCAPSRCVLMTGLHLGHSEIRANRQASNDGEGQWPISDKALTLAEVLKGAGYTTGAVGKWGLGPVGSSGDPNKQGFDLFFGYNCQAVAHSYYPSHLWSNSTKVVLNSSPIPGHAKQPEGPVRGEDWIGKEYAPDRIVKQAVDFVNANASRPFFLYCAFTEPHVALQPPQHLVDTYPADWDPQPYRGEAGYTPHPRPRAAYAAMITSLDDHVGKIMSAIEQRGLKDETVVFFTSDNGTTMPRPNSKFSTGGVDSKFFDSTKHLRGFKGSVYEGGLRVPLIVRWPGKIKPASSNDFPSYFPDHFATICDILRLNPPGKRDGVSLWPILSGSANPARNPMVWTYAEQGGQLALRMGNLKLVRQKISTAQPGAWEVYDLSKDPSEKTNIAGDQAELIRKAETLLAEQTSPNETFPIKLSR